MYLLSALSAEDVKRIHSELASLDFADGRKSAKGAAKDVKKNKQLVDDPTVKETRPLFQGLKKVLMESEKLKVVSWPRRISNIMFNRYEVGDKYGWHVDHAHMHDRRTDLSFTIFLDDPKSYEGGELEIKVDSESIRKVKGAAGQMVIYSTGLLHQVTEVTAGSRTCIVGWIESFIKSDEDRKLMFELTTALFEVKNASQQNEELGKGIDLDRLQEIQMKILRRLS